MRYDPFQQQAIDYINQGLSALVSAPTGAGKTAIAEHVIRECIRRREGVIYTAPIKALSNQKFREFAEATGGQVGILTGDITLHAQAPVLIMTTEIFRNKILENPASLSAFSWIIFDEIHYLDDYERGSVWEESLIFLPAHMKFLGLSATIPNIDELASWLTQIHGREVKVVKENKRPVPLHFFFQCQGRVYDNLEKMVRSEYKSYGHRQHGGGRHWSRRLPQKANKPSALIKTLAEEDLLPCIYFVFSRRRTELLAQEIRELNFLDEPQRQEITAAFDDLCRLFDLIGEPSAKAIRPFIERGIGYHHAGMLPTLKEVIERLFTSRLLKIIFTTETFALGINMPARSVIFDELRKFYGHGFANLRTRDFYQMAGRAGRRSIDTEGFVFCRVDQSDVSAHELRRMIYSAPEGVASQFNASYATLLNLYGHYGENLYDIYPKSFHYFQAKKILQQKAVELLRTKVNVLKELGCIRQNRLTEKGIFASNVYGYELLLSELYEDGFLESLSWKDLGIFSLAVVFEPRKGTQRPMLHQRAIALEQKTKKVLAGLRRLEKSKRLPELTKGCHFHLTPVMEAWLEGESFQQAIRHTDVDEGELVRYFRMTIQILREIAEAPMSVEFKERVWKLIRLINRDVVDAERQLRS